MSKFWQILTAKLKIAMKLLTGYHSQTDEQTKWMNQTEEMYLQHYINNQQNNWVQLLLTAQFVYNSVLNEIIKKTSFFKNYEYHLKIVWEAREESQRLQKVLIQIEQLCNLQKQL